MLVTAGFLLQLRGTVLPGRAARIGHAPRRPTPLRRVKHSHLMSAGMADCPSQCGLSAHWCSDSPLCSLSLRSDGQVMHVRS